MRLTIDNLDGAGALLRQRRDQLHRPEILFATGFALQDGEQKVAPAPGLAPPRADEDVVAGIGLDLFPAEGGQLCLEALRCALRVGSRKLAFRMKTEVHRFHVSVAMLFLPEDSDAG